MLSVRRGRVARPVLVGVLLLPLGAAASGIADGGALPAAARPCVLTRSDLEVDLAKACATVRAAVSSWHGVAVVQVVDDVGGDPGVAAEALGATVSVHREAWARLTATGRQVVLTHELVHVATAAFTTSRTPQWLVEGLADAVALRDSGLPDRVAAQELAAAVARGELPTALPAARDFEAEPALAYEQSWLAVDLMLRRFGSAAVLGLYRDAGRSPLPQALMALGARTGPAEEVLVRRRGDLPLGGRTRSGADAPDQEHLVGDTTVAWLVAALRAEIVRRLS